MPYMASRGFHGYKAQAEHTRRTNFRNWVRQPPQSDYLQTLFDLSDNFYLRQQVELLNVQAINRNVVGERPGRPLRGNFNNLLTHLLHRVENLRERGLNWTTDREIEVMWNRACDTFSTRITDRLTEEYLNILRERAGSESDSVESWKIEGTSAGASRGRSGSRSRSRQKRRLRKSKKTKNRK